MRPEDLEALDTDKLTQLIIDATKVLAARARGTSAKKDFLSAAPSAFAPNQLFTFGKPAGSSGGSPPNTLFSPKPGSCGKSEESISVPSGNKLGFGNACSPAAPGGDGYPGLAGGTLLGRRSNEAVEEAREEDDTEANVEEEVTAVHGWVPSMTLEIRNDMQTGEEGEDLLFSQRSKLYRFRDGEWKERGLGEARLLQDRTTKRVRFLLRQEKTGKVVANHAVTDKQPYCDLRQNGDAERIWVWSGQDISDDHASVEQFALKFGTKQLATAFKNAFEAAKRERVPVVSSSTDATDPSSEATSQ
eukprot:TRINITY_DN6781_c0_g1_i1.p1 TRINITY_DN6781_c0_g1~~TRINITY_DN6781_c0_g1_i1.p1  ORF type:complete len:303 (-),score=50.93 TRINITY_DN6781_c0_g1_i1:219-1127(-)